VNTNHEQLAHRFSSFAEEARELASPLYEALSRQIALDPDVLAVAVHVRRPPVPNTLFAAVHFLLMENPDHELAGFYGSLCEEPLAASAAYPVFREFLLSHRSELIPLLETRITQTNEVSRCSYLLPSFTAVHGAAGDLPLALIDVGCSAGLHLLWDRYHYDYGDVQVGDPGAAVTIKCQLRGKVIPPLPLTFPDTAFRVGIDLHPVDLTDPVERRWFEALIWPEHADRRRLAKAAIGELLDHPPRVIAGNAVEVLAAELRSVPVDTALIVCNSHALYQGGAEEIDALEEVLRACSTARPIHWLFCEGYEVRLRTLRDGGLTEKKLANKDGHGRWLEWISSRFLR
jgi:hypothetical protein